MQTVLLSLQVGGSIARHVQNLTILIPIRDIKDIGVTQKKAEP